MYFCLISDNQLLSIYNHVGISSEPGIRISVQYLYSIYKKNQPYLELKEYVRIILENFQFI